ncbi:MAG: hypothetical protein JWP89_3215 [Schlesneria sp.]|nr:hypothetical protein [Schlesneria sp.]
MIGHFGRLPLRVTLMSKTLSHQWMVKACLCLAGCVLFAGPAPGAEPEVIAQQIREFHILVDGKHRGDQSMTFSRRADGSDMMQGEAEVVINLIVYRYRYASAGTEVWKDGRLIKLVNEADYNGDKYVIQGSAVQQSLHYEVNGESQKAPSDIWAASYWREPDAKRVGKKVRLLDSDKGNQLTATIEKLDPETIMLDSTPIKTNHYHLDGDVDVDVWYDKYGLIVRQESVESGHKTRLDLVKITRGKVAAQSNPQPR